VSATQVAGQTGTWRPLCAVGRLGRRGRRRPSIWRQLWTGCGARATWRLDGAASAEPDL